MDPYRTAEAALERNLAWVRAADGKLPPVFAVDVAMLGVLGLRLPRIDSLSPWVVLAWGLAAVALFTSLVFLGLVAFPRLSGPKDSMVFFGTAAGMDEGRYIERLTAGGDQYLQDVARQAFRNAEIATAKYSHLKHALIALFVSVPFWLLALIATRQL